MKYEHHISGWSHGGFSLQSLESFVGATANAFLQSVGASVTVTQAGGLGVDITYKGETIDLTKFNLDVKDGQIDATVEVNGHLLGNVALLRLGADGTVGLTAITAHAIDTVLGSNVVSASTVFDLGKILSGFEGHEGGDDHGHHHHRDCHGNGGGAVTGGETLVVLPGSGALAAHGVTISALGEGRFESFSKGSGLLLPVTGGEITPTGDITDHVGSGVELAFKGHTVDLTNFVFDVKDGTVEARVSLDGHKHGQQTIFDIARDGAMTLTSQVADLIDMTLGKNLVSDHTVIGGGYSIALTGGGHWHDGGCGGWAGGGDHSGGHHWG